MAEVGILPLECGICGMELDIPIHAELNAEKGRMHVTTHADVSEVWLHAWTDHLEEQMWGEENGWS